MSLLLLVDLDGVVYRGVDPVPGVAAVLADRAARGDDVVYVTNNSMHYRADYVKRLSTMGCPVSPDRIVSSSRATALHIQRHEAGIRRVLLPEQNRRDVVEIPAELLKGLELDYVGTVDDVLERALLPLA